MSHRLHKFWHAAQILRSSESAANILTGGSYTLTELETNYIDVFDVLAHGKTTMTDSIDTIIAGLSPLVDSKLALLSEQYSFSTGEANSDKRNT